MRHGAILAYRAEESNEKEGAGTAVFNGATCSALLIKRKTASKLAR